VINKLRALCAWYTKGVEGGGALRGRINTAASLGEVLELVDEYFGVRVGTPRPSPARSTAPVSIG
jgi:hypothetical protein